MIAAFLDCDDCVDVLLAAGADPEAQSLRHSTPLILSAQQGSRDAMARLLRCGADASHRGWRNRTALQVAVCAHGAPDVIAALAAAGADPSEGNVELNNVTPLHTAAHLCRAAAVRALLAVGADPNARAADGVTPLMEAFSSSHSGVDRSDANRIAIAGLLARHGANLDATVPGKVGTQKGESE
jgi:uncharacterized protein